MRAPPFVAALALLAASSAIAAADGLNVTPEKKPAATPAPPDWDVAFGGSIASDYIFRGISQSAREPSASAYTEFRYNARSDLQFYGAIAGESIDYPNRAAAEIDFYGGVRPTFDSSAPGIIGTRADGSSTARAIRVPTPIAPTAFSSPAGAISVKPI